MVYSCLSKYPATTGGKIFLHIKKDLTEKIVQQRQREVG